MKKWLVRLSGLLLLAGAAQAQERYGPTGGENLLSVAGSISNFDVDGFSVLSITGQFGFGRFLTKEHEVGASVSISYLNPEDFDSSVSEGLSGYYNYNWRDQPRTWFYAGPHIGLSLTDANGDDDTSIAVGGHGGLRHWLTSRTAFFVEPRLTFASDLTISEIIFGYTIAL
jgi:hypothetical protein